MSNVDEYSEIKEREQFAFWFCAYFIIHTTIANLIIYEVLW